MSVHINPNQFEMRYVVESSGTDTRTELENGSGGTPVTREPLSDGEPTRRQQHMRRSTWIRCGCGAQWAELTVAHCAACHRSFGGVALFDRHRSIAGEHGTCLDPARIHTKDGEPVMFLRDGDIWRGPEMTEEQKAAAFGSRS